MDLPDKSKPQVIQGVVKKDIKPVIPAGAVEAPRPVTRRFMDFVFSESPKAAAQRAGRDVLWPRAKMAVQEGLIATINGMFGNAGPSPLNGLLARQMLPGGISSYNQVSTPTMLQQAAMANQSRPVNGTYQDLILPSQDYAETLLANLYALINQYNVVTVGDLKELAGITTTAADNAYGWTSLDAARIVQDRDGFRLQLPRPNLV